MTNKELMAAVITTVNYVDEAFPEMDGPDKTAILQTAAQVIQRNFQSELAKVALFNAFSRK